MTNDKIIIKKKNENLELIQFKYNQVSNDNNACSGRYLSFVICHLSFII